MTEEFPTRPLTEVIRNVAGAVGRSQSELDRQALASQRDLERAIEAGEVEYAVDAPWLRFAEVDVDLHLSLSVEGRPERDDDGTVRAYRPIVAAKPVTPRDRASYDADLTSDIRMRIVPAPAPRSNE